MAKHRNPSRIPLPRGWPRSVKSGMMHVISLAHCAMAYTRSWAANGRNGRMRLKAENDQLRQELALLAEENRIKDGHRANGHS